MHPKSCPAPIWLWLSLAFCWLPTAIALAADEQSTHAYVADVTASTEAKARRGHDLFVHNCAHCHGDDARGDEGPGLYDLRKSDARIAKIITDGIKGEMPRFGAKLNDVDIRALIAYLRALKS